MVMTGSPLPLVSIDAARLLGVTGKPAAGGCGSPSGSLTRCQAEQTSRPERRADAAAVLLEVADQDALDHAWQPFRQSAFEHRSSASIKSPFAGSKRSAGDTTRF